MNLGVKELDAEFYLLVNSDTLLRGGAIASMLAALGGDPEVGAVSPRLEWPDSAPQESCFRFHSPASELISSSGTGLVLRALSSSEVPLRVSDADTNPEWTSFACIMIRQSVFEQVGLLDDGYFMYYEDVEFCYRARRAGWKIANHPASRVVHLRGGSSSVKSNALICLS
jgi:GT2 family glycosyltransferase